MELGRRLLSAGTCALVATTVLPAQVTAMQIARIEGRVMTQTGQPVPEARVTLLNDGYSPLAAVYSDGTGRFKFTVREGAYYIEVDPLEKPFERQRQRVDLDPTPFSKIGELFLVDVILKSRKAANATPQPGAGEVVFYQDIPPPAKAEYEKGLRLLPTNSDEGCAALRSALKLFPDYYKAMESLGGEYVRAGHFDHALPILLRAVEINPSGTPSYYALGVLFYQIHHYPNAVKAFNRVLAHDHNHLNAVVYSALSLLRAGKDTEAETAFKKARELGARNIPEVHLGLSEIYIDQKKFQEAAIELEALLRLDPDRKDRKKIEDLIKSLKSRGTPESARK
jgi:tetratricopeptide (TPR) repeat protein